MRVFLYKDPTIHFHLDFSASVEARLFGFTFASLGIDGDVRRDSGTGRAAITST